MSFAMLPQEEVLDRKADPAETISRLSTERHARDKEPPQYGWGRDFGAIQMGLRGSPKSIWREFYRGREGSDYRQYVTKQYRPFLNVVLAETRTRDTLLEVGCGIGTVTNALHHFMPPGGRYSVDLICMDLCQEMVRDARKALHGVAKVIHGDIRRDTFIHCDVIHGHGVLEHMSNLDILATLAAHRATGARAAIHYVPGNGHGKPSFGDERLLPLAYWHNEFNPTESFTFNGGKDYVLTWRFA